VDEECIATNVEDGIDPVGQCRPLRHLE
jgi:hypothetical protein